MGLRLVYHLSLKPDSSTAFLGLKPVISWFGRLKLAKRAMCQRHCRREEMCQHQKWKSLRTGNSRQGVQSVQNTTIVKEMWSQWSRFVLPIDVLQRRDKTDVLITPSHCRSVYSLPDTCWRPLVSCVQTARNAPSSLHIWISMYMEHHGTLQQHQRDSNSETHNWCRNLGSERWSWSCLLLAEGHCRVDRSRYRWTYTVQTWTFRDMKDMKRRVFFGAPQKRKSNRHQKVSSTHGQIWVWKSSRLLPPLASIYEFPFFLFFFMTVTVECVKCRRWRPETSWHRTDFGLRIRVYPKFVGSSFLSYNSIW